MLALAVMPVTPAKADVTGLLSPTATGTINSVTIATNATTCGAAATTNQGWASDNAWACYDGQGDYVRYTFGNFGIPAGSTITDISVSVEGHRNGTTANHGRNLLVSLWNQSALNGYTGQQTATMTYSTTTDGTPVSLTGLWGTTWAASDFNSGTFIIQVESSARLVNNGTNLAFLDHVQVRVTYSLPPEINVQGNGVSIVDGDTTPSTADWTDFGNVPQNLFVDRTFTIQNTGTGDLSIGAITFTGGNAGDFSIVSAPAATVTPGNSTTFTVRLTAGGGGGATRDTTINIVNNDANENPYNFGVQGTRINAEINVQGNGNTITDGDGTPSTADCTNFGSTGLGGFIDCTYTIQNQGPAATNVLSVGTITIGGTNAADFSVTVPPTSPIANGASTTFTVRFSPSAAGTRNATISFINNDTNESPYNWSIQGTGIANTPPTITSNGGGTTATISVPENTTAVTTVTATDPNVPPQTLTYSISGIDAGDFAINSTSGVLTFSPAPDFEAPADADTNNSYIVIVQVSDGAGGTDSQTITVNVTNANDAPITSNVTNTTLEDTEKIISLSYTDPDGDSATSCIVSGLTSGSISTSCVCTAGACTVGITPDLNSTAQVTANYTVSDGLTSNPSTITLDVTPVNDSPAFTSAPVTSVNQNDSYLYNIVVTDPDVGDTIVIIDSTKPAWLTFTDNGNGTATLSGTPNNSAVGDHTIVLRATDNVISVPVEQAFTVTVVDVNDAPTFTSAPVTTAGESTPYTYNIVADDLDALDALTISALTLPSWLTLTDNGDRTATLSGTPNSLQVGVFNVVLEVTDSLLTASQTFDITVSNTAPQVVTASVGATSPFQVTFNQDVYNPANDTDPGDVTNPVNYMLVRDNGDGFQTTSCAMGVDPLDTAIIVNSVTYSNGGGSGPFVATVTFNGGVRLSNGDYRLFVCGSTSILDIADPTLELAGDGTPGTDFVRSFTVSLSNNGNTGENGDDDNKNKSVFGQNNPLIPVTGFAPNRITKLPAQPADKAYKPMKELRIEIPTLGVNFPIVGAAISKGGWDLTWLQNNVAYLEGSAYPTLSGNTVLTAHVMDSNNNLGPFSDIRGMKLGQQILLHFNGQVYTYQVEENKRITPSNISAVFKHENYDWITLVTCEDYDTRSGSYKYRRMVRAVLISVVPEK